jgi:hypothetical protein
MKLTFLPLLPTPHLWKIFLTLITLWSLAQCAQPGDLPPGEQDNGGLFLPGDFEALVVADSIGRARHIAVNANGDIYVKLSSSDSVYGGNVALRDTTYDGKADIIEKFGAADATTQIRIPHPNAP